jgi:hypothetical protein
MSILGSRLRKPSERHGRVDPQQALVGLVRIQDVGAGFLKRPDGGADPRRKAGPVTGQGDGPRRSDEKLNAEFVFERGDGAGDRGRGDAELAGNLREALAFRREQKCVKGFQLMHGLLRLVQRTHNF